MRSRAVPSAGCRWRVLCALDGATLFIALVQGIPIGLQSLMLLNGLLHLVFLRPDALIPGQPFQSVRAWLTGLLALEACKLLLLIWNLRQGLQAQQPDSASLSSD